MKQKNLQTKAKYYLSGYPQKKQLEFFSATEKYVAYGGARGGGKSWALRRKLILMALRYDGISLLLIRRTYAELRDNHLRVMQKELDGLCKYTDISKTFTFPNGSRIRLGYLDSENDVLQYQGQEYDVIALDEATQLTEYQFHALKGALRGANSFPKRMYLTCNPGGVGHGWVKRLFIDRDYRDGERPQEYKFIQALVYDNEVLLKKDPGYLERLGSIPKGLKNAWLNGEWESFEGQYFSEFDYFVHTCDVFPVEENAQKYCAIDYGLDMLAAVFVAVTGDGKCYVYDEIHEENLIVSKAAEKIKAKSNGVSIYIAPSDLWSRQKDSGKSIAELFGDNGVFLTKLKSDRIDGWMCLKELLKPVVDDDGVKTSNLLIMRNCTNLIRCLPLLLHDKNKAGDVSTKPHNITHAPDALRYFAVSRRSMISKGDDKNKNIKLSDKLNMRRRIKT